MWPSSRYSYLVRSVPPCRCLPPAPSSSKVSRRHWARICPVSNWRMSPASSTAVPIRKSPFWLLYSFQGPCPSPRLVSLPNRAISNWSPSQSQPIPSSSVPLEKSEWLPSKMRSCFRRRLRWPSRGTPSTDEWGRWSKQPVQQELMSSVSRRLGVGPLFQ